MALTVTQLDRGGANGVTSFQTAIVGATAGRLLILDLYFQPGSPPVTISPTIVNHATAWVREDDPAFDQYETMQRWRCEADGDTDTVDVSWTGTADVLWDLKELSGHVTGNNGADAFVQTVRAASNAVTLAAFADAANECLASFAAGFFPDPAGVVDSTLTQVGTTAASNPGLYLELVTGLGPEQGDDTYSITWTAGQYIQRACASEIAVAAGGPIEVPTERADETDTALATVPEKHATLGLSTETNDALGLAASKAVATGRADESSSALGLTTSKLAAVGLSTETGTALGLTASKSVSVGVALGSDVALARGWFSPLAGELDSALAVAAHKLATIGLAESTETALALTVEKRATVGTAEETDTAFSLLDSSLHVDTGRADETDAALGLTASKSVSTGRAEATEEALAPVVWKLVALGLATETDVALALSTGDAYERAPVARTATVAAETRRLVVAAEPRAAKPGPESRRMRA